LLDEHDIMFGYGHLNPRGRRSYEMVLEPGSTLLLYTDGLVEQRRGDIDQRIEELGTVLASTLGPDAQRIVDLLVKALVTDADDDVVALAISPQPVQLECR
jgi:hypothetical protein